MWARLSPTCSSRGIERDFYGFVWVETLGDGWVAKRGKNLEKMNAITCVRLIRREYWEYKNVPSTLSLVLELEEGGEVNKEAWYGVESG